MTIHVLAYVWRLPRLIGPDLRERAGFTHRARAVLAGLLRALAAAGPLPILAGLLIAAMTVHLAAPWAGFHHTG